MSDDFHDCPFDDGTLTKLQIFELYTQEWIPVFLAPSKPIFDEMHIFDFFCGPGTDSTGNPGSPLRTLGQFRDYHDRGLAGWDKVTKVVHLFDRDSDKIEQLKCVINRHEWKIPSLEVDCRPLVFSAALEMYRHLLSNPRIAKLLIIDQYGVDAVLDDTFKELISFPTTDFIFFLSSSILHRFRDLPSIKQKIGEPEDSYDVHRAAFDYYKKLIPAGAEVYLAPFSIKKKSNIYGLIFGSQHPLGIHKFLRVAWANDIIAGEANFDIDRENIAPNELLFSFSEMRPNKIRQFEVDLEHSLRAGKMETEADVLRFCIEAGMTCKHSESVLKSLKSDGVIKLDFRVPDVSRLKHPRQITMATQKK